MDAGDLLLHFEGANSIIRIYSEVDSAVAVFSRRYGLDCPAGCRDCCDRPSEHIEATLIEMLPMAVHLWQTGEAGQWLDAAGKASPGAHCVMFNESNPAGGCRAYPWRPLVCRLFGHSAITDKTGGPVPMICRVQHRLDPEVPGWVNHEIHTEANVPVASFYARQVMALRPDLGARLMSVNQALAGALEVAGLHFTLEQNQMNVGYEGGLTLPK